jgi:hypothetical protein
MEISATVRKEVSATPPSLEQAGKYKFTGIYFSSDVTVETGEEVPLVDVDVDVDVNAVIMVLKLIVTPALCDVSISRSEALSGVSVIPSASIDNLRGAIYSLN